MAVPMYHDQAPDQMDGADDDGSFDDPRYGRVSTNSRPSIHYVNESGLPDDVIDRHFSRGKGLREISSVIEKWSQSLSGATINQTLDVFNRNKGIDSALHIHAVMARCSWAVENDDVLSTLADVIEGLMWQKNRFELIDTDQQDMWSQWAATVNLDRFLRQCGREEFKNSQFYVGVQWGNKVYKVQENQVEEQLEEFEREREKKDREKEAKDREAFIAANKDMEGFVMPPELPEIEDDGPGRGNRKRKKTFPVNVPIALTIFDPTKVIPVGTLMFGRERFAYIATREEEEAFNQVMRGEVADPMVRDLIEAKYQPTGMDRAACADIGVDYSKLWLFRQDALFRHTQTKAEYERYAPVRLKTVLPILEMKQHLRASDRASLIGNTNFIVVITKGTDKLPAKPAEIANLQEQARVIARLPVLVGDHRLHVEIISPSTDNTLIDSRWQVLDGRLVFAALRTFSPVTQGGNSSGAGVKEMSQIVAQGLMSRRHMITRTIEAKLFQMIMDKNDGVIDEFPKLEFSPKRITVDFNQDIMNGILKLRDRGDISRETTLEELDFDQETEALRRGREKVVFDDTFQSQTPHSSPTSNPYGAPGQAVPGLTPPQLPPGGNQNVQNNLGPKGQPRTEGGRPAGAKDKRPRKTAAAKDAAELDREDPAVDTQDDPTEEN
jgi:hypothetical protein